MNADKKSLSNDAFSPCSRFHSECQTYFCTMLMRPIASQINVVLFLSPVLRQLFTLSFPSNLFALYGPYNVNVISSYRIFHKLVWTWRFAIFPTKVKHFDEIMSAARRRGYGKRDENEHEGNAGEAESDWETKRMNGIAFYARNFGLRQRGKKCINLYKCIETIFECSYWSEKWRSNVNRKRK